MKVFKENIIVNTTYLNNLLENIKNDRIGIIYDSIDSLREEVEEIEAENNLYQSFKRVSDIYEELRFTMDRLNNEEKTVDLRISHEQLHINKITVAQEEFVYLLKSSVPTSYIVFLCSFIVILTFSVFSVIIGIAFNVWLLNFWVLCFILLGSTGMVATIITAIIEWRKNVQKKYEK